MSSKSVLIYRGIVLALAVGYCIRTLVFADFTQFAGPFRYLTIWALFLSAFAASRMMAYSLGRTDNRADGFVGAVAVINAMVVYLYWRLYFNDPMSVTQNGELGRWWLEYYMHGLGPLLQWIDVLIIHKSIRRPAVSGAWLVGIIALYVSWTELVIRPLATDPVGTVTSGLPYRFLNNMELPQRAEFYGMNFAMALVLLAVFWAIAWGVRRLRPPAAP
jgi:phosphatidylserine synthase